MPESDFSVTPELLQLDDSIYGLVKGINILDAVAPLNYREERAAFFDAHYSKNPEFVYDKHEIDSFSLKRALFNVPVEQANNEDLYTLYSDIISAYVDKIDQFQSIGTSNFLYDSLRYYGEPSEKDIRNAHFILHLPNDIDSASADALDAPKIQTVLEQFAQTEGYAYEIRLDDSMIANALVSGSTVKINSNALVSPVEANALAHHELGVHLLTTINARSQPLKVMSMGCPLNTTTQEGLAILCEYLAGCMTISRLKVLALRVLAVKSLIEEKNFRSTFLMLKEQHGMPDDQAFTITARVYRGGGFTKDYMYLQGFHQMLNAYEHEDDFNLLLCGKASHAYLPAIRRLVDSGLLKTPGFISPAIRNPQENDSIKRFIAHAIK